MSATYYTRLEIDPAISPNTLAALHDRLAETANSLADEYDAKHRIGFESCAQCANPIRGGPGHFGSTGCRSYSPASGGNHNHCSCDTCF